jgi:hypothetical protein
MEDKMTTDTVCAETFYARSSEQFDVFVEAEYNRASHLPIEQQPSNPEDVFQPRYGRGTACVLVSQSPSIMSGYDVIVRVLKPALLGLMYSEEYKTVRPLYSYVVESMSGNVFNVGAGSLFQIPLNVHEEARHGLPEDTDDYR